jgi:hypothetical protein
VILLAAYAVAWLPCARWLFRRWRIAEALITETAGKRCIADHRYGGAGCCYKDRSNLPDTADALASALAMIAAVAWPVVLLAIAVRWRPDGSLRANTRDAIALVLPSRRKARRRPLPDIRVAALELASRDPEAPG